MACLGRASFFLAGVRTRSRSSAGWEMGEVREVAVARNGYPGITLGAVFSEGRTLCARVARPEA
jgi:hypothetical protein